MASPADIQLLNELDWLSARAMQMVARIHEHLNRTERAITGIQRAELLNSERELRETLEEAMQAASRLRVLPSFEQEEQRSRDALVVRKGILAIELRVARLAVLLEALL